MDTSEAIALLLDGSIIILLSLTQQQIILFGKSVSNISESMPMTSQTELPYSP
jgi:hypothetical protein